MTTSEIVEALASGAFVGAGVWVIIWALKERILAACVALCIAFWLLITIHVARAEETGKASFYSKPQGVACRGAGRFDPNAMTAAHRTLPCGTKIQVSRGDRSVVVTITDRGPAKRTGRVLDLSRAAFRRIASERAGVVVVSYEPVEKIDTEKLVEQIEALERWTYERRFYGCTIYDPC